MAEETETAPIPARLMILERDQENLREHIRKVDELIIRMACVIATRVGVPQSALEEIIAETSKEMNL